MPSLDTAGRSEKQKRENSERAGRAKASQAVPKTSFTEDAWDVQCEVMEQEANNVINAAQKAADEASAQLASMHILAATTSWSDFGRAPQRMNHELCALPKKPPARETTAAWCPEDCRRHFGKCTPHRSKRPEILGLLKVKVQPTRPGSDDSERDGGKAACPLATISHAVASWSYATAWALYVVCRLLLDAIMPVRWSGWTGGAEAALAGTAASSMAAGDDLMTPCRSTGSTNGLQLTAC